MRPNSIISISSYKAELCRFSYSNDMLENNEQYTLAHYGYNANATIEHMEWYLFKYIKIEVRLFLWI